MSITMTNNATDLLAELNGLGVELAADGDRLRFRPRKKVTAELAARLKAHKAELLVLLQPSPPTGPPAMPEAWFVVGASAPCREHFAYDPETKTHPGWWDYLYEVHNRRLIVVGGIVRREA